MLHNMHIICKYVPYIYLPKEQKICIYIAYITHTYVYIYIYIHHKYKIYITFLCIYIWQIYKQEYKYQQI